MEIKFADTFTKSLKRLARQNTWWYKTYSLFRYDFPRFFKNIWKFRKALWNHYWFDHHGTLRFMEIGIRDMADKTEKYGLEVDHSRLKKVSAMRRAADLIKNYNEDLYLDMAEAELGEISFNKPLFEQDEDNPDYYRMVDQDTPEESEHKKKVYARKREIEEQEWNELWTIIRGQDMDEFRAFYKKVKSGEADDFEKEQGEWDNWFDGTGMKGWWD
jgi:hypothetical protein